MSISVGFQGSEGSFTHKAATNFFSPICSDNVVFSPMINCKTIFEQVGGGNLSYGVIPVESSNHGTMPMYLESLLKYSGNVRIVAETIERQNHCLCAPPGVTEATISRVISHPIILDDCSVFLEALAARSGASIEQVSASDSAAACKQLSGDSAASTSAVLCTREAAALYGLTVLSESVGNDRNSETRYIIIAPSATSDGAGDVLNLCRQDQRNPNEKLKGSLTLSIKNTRGSMFKMMSCFSLRDINVLKIESRPSSAAIGMNDSVGSVFRHWDTIFFIDYEVSENEVTNTAMWANLNEYCDWTRSLGEYKQFGESATITERANWNSMLDILATA